MPRLSLGLGVQNIRKVGRGLPIPASGLSLWLKADAGVTTGSFGGVNSTTGKVGNCASFDGQNGGGSYNSRLYTNSFGVDINSNFSFSVWMKPRNFSSYQHIIGAPFQNGFYIGADETDLTFSLYNGVAFGITAPTVTPDTWNHYVFIRDGDTLKLYANNTFIGDVSVAGESFTGDLIFSVGGGENNEYFFNGDIDEMALYSRAITVSEISTLYNSGNGTNYAGSPSSSMVSYWSLNESSGIRYDSHGSNDLSEAPSLITGVTAWADQSGNGKNATAIYGPILSTVGGKIFVDFAGGYFTGNELITEPYATIMCVARFSSTRDIEMIFQQFDGDNSSGSVFLYRGFNSNSGFRIYNGDDLSSLSLTNNNQTYLFGATINDDSGTLYLNATQDGAGSSGTITPLGGYLLGSWNGGTTTTEMQMAEIVIYNRVLTTQERQQVEAYLNAKYAIY